MSRKRRAAEADIGKLEWYNHYYNLFYLYATNMITWKNVPDTVDADTIERLLITRGLCCFHTKYLGELTVMALNPANRRDIYGYPTEGTVMSYNDVFKMNMPAKEFVPMFNNNKWQPTIIFLQKWAWQLADIEMMMTANRSANKTTVLYKASSEKQMTSLTNVFDRIQRNEPAIFVDEISRKAAGIENPIEVIDTKAKFLIPELQAYKDKIIDDVCEFLGISVLDTEKKERLVSKEADANKERIQMARTIMLKRRIIDAEKVNKRYGTNIYPEFSLKSMKENIDFSEELEKGVNTNGNNDGTPNDTDPVSEE